MHTPSRPVGSASRIRFTRSGPSVRSATPPGTQSNGGASTLGNRLEAGSSSVDVNGAARGSASGRARVAGMASMSARRLPTANAMALSGARASTPSAEPGSTQIDPLPHADDPISVKPASPFESSSVGRVGIVQPLDDVEVQHVGHAGDLAPQPGPLPVVEACDLLGVRSHGVDGST